MLVAATSRCFFDMPLEAAISRMVDLEYTAVEIMIHEAEGHLKPSEVAANLEGVIQTCSRTRRLTTVAYSIQIDAPEPQYYQQFEACCRLAKATKVFTLVVRSSELGTPFNAEIERLREMVRIANHESVLVAMTTETGRMTQDPDTAVVLCDNVRGLALNLDPSHYICGPHQDAGFDQVMKHVGHVHLRDTSKEEPQVRIGKGLVEYGRLVTQLNKVGYDRGLSVDITPQEGVDHHAEMRKMRLLLESLL